MGLGGINLKKVVKNFCEKFTNLTLESKFSEKEDVFFIKGNLYAQKFFDDGIFLEIKGFKDGCAHVFMTFDRMDPDEDNLLLVNKLNSELQFAKGYIDNINGDCYFVLKYTFFNAKNENEYVDNLVFALSNLLHEDTLEVLKPITEVTE